MDKNQILLVAAIAVVLGIRLYKKFKKKDKIKSGTEEKSSASTAFPTVSKDDEYEPYSKK